LIFSFVWLGVGFVKFKRMSCPEEPPPSGLNRAEHNWSRDDQLNVSAGIWIADDAEPTANPNRPLLHSGKAKVSRFSVPGKIVGNASTVVPHSYCQVASIMERNPQFSSLRVQKSISNGLGTDSEDLITHDRVHLSRGTFGDEGEPHRPVNIRGVGRQLKSLRQIIPLCGRSA
jgi:hypothetical protein